MRVGRRERETERNKYGGRARERGGGSGCVLCVWVGETRLGGACGGAGYVCVCVRKWLEAEEELGVGPHTYTLPFSQALCVCVLFMPLLRRCAIWNKSPIWAVLTLEAAHLAAMAESVLRTRCNRHTATFHQFHRTESSCLFFFFFGLYVYLWGANPLPIHFLCCCGVKSILLLL